jgi:hypothetical protein
MVQPFSMFRTEFTAFALLRLRIHELNRSVHFAFFYRFLSVHL